MKHCASSKTVHTIAQHVVHCTFDERHTFTWHLHSFPHNDTTLTSSNFLSSEINTCADPREVSIGYLADPTTRTGYEPKDLAGKRGSTCQTVVLPPSDCIHRKTGSLRNVLRQLIGRSAIRLLGMRLLGDQGGHNVQPKVIKKFRSENMRS